MSPTEQIVNDHRALVAAKEALIDLGGRCRLAWFRDPKGIGTDAELRAAPGSVRRPEEVAANGGHSPTDLDRIASLLSDPEDARRPEGGAIASAQGRGNGGGPVSRPMLAAERAAGL